MNYESEIWRLEDRVRDLEHARDDQRSRINVLEERLTHAVSLLERLKSIVEVIAPNKEHDV